MKLGILGGGQLGRMLALAAHPLGIEPVIVDPKPECSARAVAPVHCLDWLDDGVPELLADCDAITYEFENVPVELVHRLDEGDRVRPGAEVLAETQDRLREKALLSRLGFPVPRHARVDTEAELQAAVQDIGLPAVLKTRRMGYDGRGQRMLRAPADVTRAWVELGGVPLILEQCIAFDREVSIVAVRSLAGEVRFWPLTQNRHVDGILRISRAPADCHAHVLERGQAWVRRLLEDTGYVGVVAVEFFACGDEWIANEIACRVHNSGHWTDMGAVTSQFENHVRAVSGLPLGSTRALGAAAMVNLIGAPTRAEPLLEIPGVRPHFYGKSPAPGRKLGHVSLLANEGVELEQRLRDVVDRVGDPATTGALQADD